MNKIIFLLVLTAIFHFPLLTNAKQVEDSPKSSVVSVTPSPIAFKQSPTITIRKSWWQRIQESFYLAIIGCFLFIFSIPMLWFNERRLVQTNQLISDAKKSTIELPIDKVNHENEGKLVYTTGFTKTPKHLYDDEVNIIFDEVIKVKRNVEMLQMVQFVEGKSDRDQFGGGEDISLKVKYEPLWTQLPIDSSSYRDYLYRNVNPPASAWPIASKLYKSDVVSINAHSMSPDQINRLMISDNCIIENFKIEKFSNGLKKKLDGAYVYNTKNEIYVRFKDPSADSIGDIRITYTLFRNKDVTVVAEQYGASFNSYDLTKKPLGNGSGPYYLNRHADDIEGVERSSCCCCGCCCLAGSCANALCQTPTTIDWLFERKLTKDQVFTDASKTNSMLTGVFRFFGFALMWLGIFLFFFPLYELLQVLPLLTYFGQFIVAVFALAVAIPLSILIISLAWLFYRPLLTFFLIVLIVPFVIYLSKVGVEAEKAGVLATFF